MNEVKLIIFEFIQGVSVNVCQTLGSVYVNMFPFRGTGG